MLKCVAAASGPGSGQGVFFRHVVCWCVSSALSILVIGLIVCLAETLTRPGLSLKHKVAPALAGFLSLPGTVARCSGTCTQCVVYVHVQVMSKNNALQHQSLGPPWQIIDGFFKFAFVSSGACTDYVCIFHSKFIALTSVMHLHVRARSGDAYIEKLRTNCLVLFVFGQTHPRHCSDHGN